MAMRARLWLPSSTAAFLIGAIAVCGIACRTTTGRDTTDDATLANTTTLPADVEIQRDPGTRTITLLRAKNLSAATEKDDEAFLRLQMEDRHAAVALAFLSAHRALFGLQDPPAEFGIKSVIADPDGFKHIRLQQRHAGLPVWGTELIVHLDEANHVYLVQGRYTPTPSAIRTTPAVKPATAFQIVAAALPGVGSDCSGCRAELVIYLLEGRTPRLAHRVRATRVPGETWTVMVDAETGAILERIAGGGSAKSAPITR